MYLFLFYKLNPLPRSFGYLGFGLSYHSYLLNQTQHFPSWIQLPLSISVTNGSSDYSATVVIIPGSATSGTREYSATVVIIPGSATSGTREHSATVVIIPGSATSGTRDHSATVARIPDFSYPWNEGLLCYGNYSTGLSYQWDTPDNT
jgi:hypothetical protein